MAFDREEWKPNIKQAPFLSLPDTIKEAFYGGGAGSGKSDVLLVYPLARKWHEHPRFKQVFMRRTFPELRNEIVPRSRELYRHYGAHFNRTEMLWTFPREDQFGTGVGHSNNGGALIYLGHCENEDDVHKYDSMEINLFTPDELTSFTEWIYLYIGFTRVRTSVPELPEIIRAAGMPGNVGHTFVKNRFIEPYRRNKIDPYNHGNTLIIGKGGNKRIYIHATLADNPHISKSYSQSLEELTDAEKKAKKAGDWDAYLGLVFEEFRDKPYDDEPANAQHVIPPFLIPHYWPKMVIGDWGFAAMTYVSYWAISPKKRLYLYREQAFRKTKIEEWAPFVKYYTDKEKPVTVRFCKSAGQDRGQEQTIQQQISDALGVPIELSNNSPGSRIAGKSLVHEYLRWKPKKLNEDEIPEFNEEWSQWLLRNRGLKAYKDYMAQYDAPEPEDNIPKLQIFKCDDEVHTEHEHCCPLMIDAIKACNYAKPKNNKPAEDVAEWDGDDPYDTLRYALDSAEAFFDTAKEEWDRVQKQALIEAKVVETGNWTAYYRDMYGIDNGQPVTAEGLVRFTKNLSPIRNTMEYLKSLGDGRLGVVNEDNR
jgi:hypothetical protein